MTKTILIHRKHLDIPDPGFLHLKDDQSVSISSQPRSANAKRCLMLRFALGHGSRRCV
jgi:hypothetical protein